MTPGSAGEKPSASLGAADRAAIADLIHGYAWHFDRNEPAALAALFSDDAVIDYGPEIPNIVGRANIVPAIAPGLQTIFAATSHHISNVRITPDGPGTARLTAYVYAWHRYHSGAPDGYLWGQYHCRVRRTTGAAGRWLIAELVLQAAGLQDFHRATMHPIARRP